MHWKARISQGRARGQLPPVMPSASHPHARPVRGGLDLPPPGYGPRRAAMARSVRQNQRQHATDDSVSGSDCR
jgi:hypothetical protein